MIPDYHFISGSGSVYIQFTYKQITEHYPDSQGISQQELRVGMCCILSINIIKMLVLTIVTVLRFCKLRYKILVRPIIFFFDIVSRIMWCCKVYAHQVIVCTRNLNPRYYGLCKAKLDTNYPHQNGQTPTQAPLAFY